MMTNMKKHKYEKEKHKLDNMTMELDSYYRAISTAELSNANALKGVEKRTMSEEDYKLFEEMNNDKIKNLYCKIRSIKVKIFFKRLKLNILYGKYMGGED